VPTLSSAAARAATAPVSRRWPWARLLRRVFALDVLVCDRCAGPRRILGAVTEPEAVRRLPGALGLAAQPPPGQPAPPPDVRAIAPTTSRDRPPVCPPGLSVGFRTSSPALPPPLPAPPALRYRSGAPPAADVDALVDLVVRLARFAAEHADAVAEVDLNPVIVHDKSLTVVDGLIVLQRRS
jgi:hypothetical protein